MRPTKAHYLRKLAEKAGGEEPSANLAGYELVLTQLNTHKRQLKQIQSKQRKADFKRKIFAEYQPWIEGALKAGGGRQDDVLMTWLVWAIDTGDYYSALTIGSYAIAHDLAMPEPYTRTTATVLVEELAEASKHARDSKQPFDLRHLLEVHRISKVCDMPDEVRAKLFRELAERLAASDPIEALHCCNAALELDGKAGVKGLRTKLEKRLNLK